jgi:hypothetical protein
VTETLAHISNNAVYSATIVYALAMLSHVAEWANARQLASDAPQARRALVSASVSDQVVTPPAALEPPSEEYVERSDRFGRIG